MGELAGVGSQQLVPPEGGVTYAAILAGPVSQISDKCFAQVHSIR